MNSGDQGVLRHMNSAEYRLAALEKWNGSFKTRVFQRAKVLGGTVLIADVAARVYVWTAADASPTFSPVLTYLTAKTGLAIHNVNPIVTVEYNDPTTGEKKKFVMDARLSEAENKISFEQVGNSSRIGGSVTISSIEMMTALALIGRVDMTQQRLESLRSKVYSYEGIVSQRKGYLLNSTYNSYFREVQQELEKAQMSIAVEESRINNLRAAQIQEAIESGRFGKFLRGVRVVGTSLLVLDAFGRVIQWNATDTEPKFSPLGTLLLATAKQSGKIAENTLDPILDDAFGKPKNRFLEQPDKNETSK